MNRHRSVISLPGRFVKPLSHLLTGSDIPHPGGIPKKADGSSCDRPSIFGRCWRCGLAASARVFVDAPHVQVFEDVSRSSRGSAHAPRYADEQDLRMKVVAKLAALFAGALGATLMVAVTLQDRANHGPADGSYVPSAEVGIDERGWRTDPISKRELTSPPKTLRMPIIAREAADAG